MCVCATVSATLSVSATRLPLSLPLSLCLYPNGTISATVSATVPLPLSLSAFLSVCLCLSISDCLCQSVSSSLQKALELCHLLTPQSTLSILPDAACVRLPPALGGDPNTASKAAACVGESSSLHESLQEPRRVWLIIMSSSSLCANNQLTDITENCRQYSRVAESGRR